MRVGWRAVLPAVAGAVLLVGLPQMLIQFWYAAVAPPAFSQHQVVTASATAVVIESFGSRFASPDGLGVWQDVTLSPPVSSRGPTDRACTAQQGRRCWRVDPSGLRVEHSDDAGGTWRTVWSRPDGRVRWLERAHHGLGSRGSARTMSVTVQPVAGQPRVLVALGAEGLLIGERGAWRQVPVVVRLSPDTHFPSGMRTIGTPFQSQWPLWLVGPELLLAVPGAVVVFLAGAVAAARRSRPRLPIVCLATLAWCGAAAPYLGWSLGVPDSYAVATMAAAALAGLATAAVRAAAADRPATATDRAAAEPAGSRPGRAAQRRSVT
jgi:hypothetical protein